MRLVLVVGLATLAGCSGKKQEPLPSQEPMVGQHVRGDGGVTVAVGDGDPSRMHMDEDVGSQPAQPQPPPPRQAKPIDITLRSMPPGAHVAVDGTGLGTTPQYWSGMADGREHEFVFTLRGYALARYRFVPVTSGVIHGRLDPIREETDAGVPLPPHQAVPSRATPSVDPPAAPSTIVDDASTPAPTGSSDSPVGPHP